MRVIISHEFDHKIEERLLCRFTVARNELSKFVNNGTQRRLVWKKTSSFSKRSWF